MMRVDAWTLQDAGCEAVAVDERAHRSSPGPGAARHKGRGHDGDGDDEILNGSIAIDQTARAVERRHGPRRPLLPVRHRSRRPGLEIWYTLEDPHPQNGVSLWDAKSGALIFGTPEPIIDNQVAGGLAGDSTPRIRGWKCGATSSSTPRAGRPSRPRRRRTSWCGGTRTRCGSCTARAASRSGRRGAGGDRGQRQRVADITGDWREEMVTFAAGALRIYTTPIAAAGARLLMEDPLYGTTSPRWMGYSTYRWPAMPGRAGGEEGGRVGREEKEEGGGRRGQTGADRPSLARR